MVPILQKTKPRLVRTIFSEFERDFTSVSSTLRESVSARWPSYQRSDVSPKNCMASRLNTKTPIVRFMAEYLSEFKFDTVSKPNLVFREPQATGLFRCIAIGRSSNPYGIYPNFAVTYNRGWGGGPASPLGRDAGIANLKLDSHAVPASDQWITFEPNSEGLTPALNSFYEIYRELVVPVARYPLCFHAIAT